MDLTLLYDLAEKYKINGVERDEIVNSVYIYIMDNGLSDNPEEAFKKVYWKYKGQIYRSPLKSNICESNGETFDLFDLIADEKTVEHNEGRRISDDKVERVKKLAEIKSNSFKIFKRFYPTSKCDMSSYLKSLMGKSNIYYGMAAGCYNTNRNQCCLRAWSKR